MTAWKSLDGKLQWRVQVQNFKADENLDLNALTYWHSGLVDLG
jgi:hypothetical protein